MQYKKALKRTMVVIAASFFIALFLYSSKIGYGVWVEQVVANKGEEDLVQVSHLSGYYDTPFELTLTFPTNMHLYYTLDGSMPTRDSFEYSGVPIYIKGSYLKENPFLKEMLNNENGYYNADEATIVRAVLFDEISQKRDEISLIYFVNCKNYNAYKQIPIISIICEDADLFDDETGIYVKGTLYEQYPDQLIEYNAPANYNLKGKIVERKCQVDYFEKDFKWAFSRKCGLRIRGGMSRETAQKGFNIYVRPEYELKMIPDIFDYSDREFSSLAIMTDYGDATKVKIPLGVELGDKLCFDTLKCKPCNVFLNGRYWGIYYISERYDADYFYYHYNVNEKDMIMLKKTPDDTFVEIGEENDIEEYNTLLRWVRTHDLSMEDTALTLSDYLDLDNFIDYYAFECCIGNRDWPHSNYGLWKSKSIGESPYCDGKWRFLLYDTNGGSCWGVTSLGRNIYEKLGKDELFVHLMQNEKIKERFITRICDIINTICAEEEIQKITDNYVLQLEKSYLLDAEVFHGDYENKNMEQAIKDEIEEYVYLKEDIMLQQTREALQIEEEVVDFALVVPDAGTDCIIKVNGLSVDLPYGSWLGRYYAGCPIELEIITDNDSDFDFKGWELSTEENLIEQKKIYFTIPEEGIVVRALE